MNIGGYVFRRIIMIFPVLLGVTVLVFAILHLVPGDPVQLVLGDMASDEAYERTRHQLGLDKPLVIQYWSFLGQLMQGDLGKSVIHREDVARLLARKLPNTLALTLTALVLSYIVGIALGTVAAIQRNGIVDYASMGLAIVGVSVPQFWLGFLLIILFAVRLRLFPIAGYGTLRHLVLPALTLSLASMAEVARMTRSSLLEVTGQEYVTTARAKGLRELRVVLKHALRNALIPIVSLLGLKIGWLFGGAVVIEIVFLRPGIGRMLIDGIYMRDFPVVQGVTLVLAATVILGNLVADVLYAVINPRVKY